MSKDDSVQPAPLLSPLDLALLRDLQPRLSPRGRHFIDLLLKVLDQDGQFNTANLAGILQNQNTVGEGSVELLSALINMLNSSTGRA